MHPQPFFDDVDTDIRGLSEPYGSWNTICMSRRNGSIAELQARDRLAEEHDRPCGGDQPQDRQAERGLAGAGFADDAERLALAHRELTPSTALMWPTTRRSTPRLIGNQTLRSSVIHHRESGRSGAGSGFGSAASSAWYRDAPAP